MKKPLKGSITVRLSMRSLKILKARARKSRKTASELVRELLEGELSAWPEGVSAWDLSKDLVGSISNPDLPHGARVREALEDWNPDRR